MVIINLVIPLALYKEQINSDQNCRMYLMKNKLFIKKTLNNVEIKSKIMLTGDRRLGLMYYIRLLKEVRI